MIEPVPPSHRIDARAARRRFARRRDAAADVLAAEVGRRMADRLDVVRIDPAVIVDAGAGFAASETGLRRRYPRAYYIGLDSDCARMDRSARPWRERLPWRSRLSGRLCADFSAMPLRDRSVGLLWSVLALAWARDTPAALREWHRVLDIGGLAMFATYGPDTLKELRAAFRGAGEDLRVHGFTDLHDIGDMLVAAGFADPVMEAEWITLTYERVDGLVADLRATGQTNVLAARPRGLLSPRRWQAACAAYETLRQAGRLPATFEIIYGHAWRAPARRLSDGRAVIRFERQGSPDRQGGANRQGSADRHHG